MACGKLKYGDDNKIHVFAIDADGNKKDHMLSCFERNELGHCYLI